MKTQILKTAVLLAVGASLTACGDSSKGKSNIQSGLDAKTQTEKEFTGEPASAEEMANQTYLLKTDRQEFALKKLAHLVWAKFECKAQFPDGDTVTEGQVTVSFYPALDIRNKVEDGEKTIVSPDEACGRKLPGEQNVIPTGMLMKDESNQYSLQYGLPGADAPILAMKWDAAGAVPGEISCMGEEGEISKATLTQCTIVPVTPEAQPEVQE